MTATRCLVAVGFGFLLAGCSRTAKPTIRNPSPTQLSWIAPGTFVAPASQYEGSGIATQTAVRITSGFFMRRFEVTQGEYLAVRGLRQNPSRFQGATNLPVEGLNWYDAVEFCKALTERERASGNISPGYEYRLPTEAEWEYACRAGSTNRFHFGDSAAALGDYAWFDDNSGRRTHPVGQKRPNAWGLHDMYGNVSEWCLDWWGEYPLASVDPKGPAKGSLKVERGGCWGNAARDCSSTARNGERPTAGGDATGFRPVLAPVR